MSTAEQVNDDVLKSQQLSNEQTGDDKQGFLLKFWSKTGKCVTGGEFAELPDGFTRTVILKNDGQIPACQSLTIGPCENETAIGFIEVDYLDHLNPGRFALSYDLPNPSASADSVGCLGVQPEPPDNDFWREMGDNFDNITITIPSESNCSSVVSNMICEEITAGNTTSWKPPGCNSTFVESIVCTPGVSRKITWYYDTTENSTSCQSPPKKNCDVTTEATCEHTSETNLTTCWYTQRNAVDLLVEMHQYFESSPECNDASQSISMLFYAATPITRPVFSRSYGRDCGYDDEVAIMPLQLFAYASDPVLLFSDATGLCLAANLSLVPCTDVMSTTEWVHVFGEENSGGGSFILGVMTTLLPIATT